MVGFGWLKSREKNAAGSKTAHHSIKSSCRSKIGGLLKRKKSLAFLSSFTCLRLCFFLQMSQWTKNGVVPLQILIKIECLQYCPNHILSNCLPFRLSEHVLIMFGVACFALRLSNILSVQVFKSADILKFIALEYCKNVSNSMPSLPPADLHVCCFTWKTFEKAT